jgi:hypothetical protein
MTWLELGSIPYNEHLVFVWIASGRHGEPRAAFVIDGREYRTDNKARAAIRDALERTDRRAQIAEWRPTGIPGNEKELDYWPSWAEFRGFLDVYGPVYPWRRPTATPAIAAPPRVSAPQTPAAVSPTPLYDERHFQCWGQLIEIFPTDERPYDPILGRPAEGYGLNGYTGEFEPDTRRVLQVAHGFEDDETWPMRDEDEFVDAVEAARERLLRDSFFQRHDKPEIFAAYEAGQPRRTTYEMWRQVHRRRAYFLAGKEPVRLDLADDGTPAVAWRLDMTTGRIVPGDRTAGLLTGDHQRVTELTWLLAVEERRRKLKKVDGAIAKAYRKAARERDKAYRRMILTETFDLWAEKFAAADAADPRLRAEVAMAALRVQLEPILRAIATDPTGGALQELRPKDADYATVFVAEAVASAQERYELLWNKGIGFRQPGNRTQLRIHVAPAGALADDNAMSRPFPVGYRSIANLLVPSRVWAAWQYHAPGNTAGLSYDGLVWCDDHWAFFPKPYRVLTA